MFEERPAQADLCVHFNQRSSTLEREGFHVNENQYVAFKDYIISQKSVDSCVWSDFDGSIIGSGSGSVNLLLIVTWIVIELSSLFQTFLPRKTKCKCNLLLQ